MVMIGNSSSSSSSGRSRSDGNGAVNFARARGPLYPKVGQCSICQFSWCVPSARPTERRVKGMFRCRCRCRRRRRRRRRRCRCRCRCRCRADRGHCCAGDPAKSPTDLVFRLGRKQSFFSPRSSFSPSLSLSLGRRWGRTPEALIDDGDLPAVVRLHHLFPFGGVSVKTRR